MIPRNRFDLARTIGRMVSEQLLSAKALQEQLDIPEFRESLKRWIGERRRALMQRPIGSTGRNAVAEDGPGDAAATAESSPSFPEELLEELLGAFLRSPQCAAMVQSLAVQATEGIGGKRISDITSADDLARFVHGNVLPAFRNEELGNTASEVRQQLDPGPAQPEQATEGVPDPGKPGGGAVSSGETTCPWPHG